MPIFDRTANGVPVQSTQATFPAMAASDQQPRPVRARGRRRRGCQGGERHKRTRKDPESNSERSGHSPCLASPSPVWRCLLEHKICFLDRTLDMDQRESAYEYLTVLLQISGTRPRVIAQQAITAVATKYGVPLDEQLEIHAAPLPFDFLLILPDHASYLTVLNGDRTVQTPAFTLTIRPWHRLIYADHGALYHKVQIEIERISPHVWEPSTAAELLRPYCSVVNVHPEMLARRNLAVYKLSAWTTWPERIPDSMVLAVPEPEIFAEAAEHMRRTLKYTVLIRVRRLLLRMPPDSLPQSPPPTPPTTETSEDESPERAPRRAQSRVRRKRCHRRSVATPPTPDMSHNSMAVAPYGGVEALEASGDPLPTATERAVTTPCNSTAGNVPVQGAPTFKSQKGASTPTEEEVLLLCLSLSKHSEPLQPRSYEDSPLDPMLLEAAACHSGAGNLLAPTSGGTVSEALFSTVEPHSQPSIESVDEGGSRPSEPGRVAMTQDKMTNPSQAAMEDT